MTAETMTSEAEQMGFPWWLVLIEGIAVIILGVLMLTNPAATTVVLVQVLGLYWLIKGVLSIVSIFMDSTAWGWKIFVGILGIIAGIIVLQHPLLSPLAVGTALVIILGLEGIIIGVINIIQAFQGAGWGAGILGVLSIILGVILLANVFLATFALPLVLGIFMIIGGIAAVIMAFRLK